MAISAALITGHGDGEHITSFDARAFNRSMFGKGKYILQDADNLKVQVSALTGTIQISAGSCLWSGMHIRVEEEGAVTYTTPASTDYVYVWLHYLRNPENLVESVEFVATSGAKPELGLIVDNLTDEMTEAYTLFCSFTHDTATNTAQGITSDFAFRSPLDDTAKSQSSSQSALQTSVANQITTLSNTVASQVEDLTDKVDSTSSDILTKIGTELVNLGTKKLNEQIYLSESLENFTFIGIQVSYSYVEEFKVYPVSFVRTSWFDKMITFAAQDQSTLNVITFKLNSDIVSGQRFSAHSIWAKAHTDEGALGGGYTQKDIDPSKITVRVFGIGRIREA